MVKYNREGDLLFTCAKDNKPNVRHTPHDISTTQPATTETDQGKARGREG